MSKGRNKPPDSIPNQPTDFVMENFLRELGNAVEGGEVDRALELLNSTPRSMQKQPEFLLIRGSVFMTLGDMFEALKTFRDVERKFPDFLEVSMPLALVYMSQDWIAHALSAAKRALTARFLPDDGREQANAIVNEATALLSQQAETLGLPFEPMHRAASLYEKAQMALEKSRLSEAESMIKQALRIAPAWDAAQIEHAELLYFLGKTNEAVTSLERMLSQNTEHPSVLRSLVMVHYGLGHIEQAQAYANRLAGLFKKDPDDSHTIESLITALSLLENTPAIWKITQQFLNAPFETLEPRVWFCLAVAAVWSGKEKVALQILERIREEVELTPMSEKLLTDLEEIKSRKSPRLDWLPTYPGVDLYLIPSILEELDDLQGNFIDPVTPAHTRKLNSFLRKYPFMVMVLKRLLWQKDHHSLALQLLLIMQAPDADAEILRFALSQTGSLNVRTSAILMLLHTERYTGTKIVRMWHEDAKEWRDVELNTQRIGDPEVSIRPAALALLEKARKTANAEQAIALLRKAVEQDPTSPVPTFNLGVTLVQNGMEDEGNALIYRSVEIDPNYTFGHASIALYEAERRFEQRALDHLQVVAQADVVAPDTAVMASLARAELAMRHNDLEQARTHLDMAASINPEFRLLEHYEQKLKEAEQFEKHFGFIFEYQRKSKERAHLKLLKQPLTADVHLRACLERYNTDMLAGVAQFLGSTAGGKKEQRISQLAEALRDVQFLRRVVEEYLKEDERMALRWLLEMEGIRPWKEFTRKYGDGKNELTAWNFHQPESVPGRLRVAGLFFTGTLDGEQVALIPADLRAILRDLLQ